MKKLLLPLARKAHITLEHELTFPESGDFRAKTSPIGLAVITKLSEERLPFVNYFPDFEKDRVAMKAKEPFVL